MWADMSFFCQPNGSGADIITLPDLMIIPKERIHSVSTA